LVAAKNSHGKTSISEALEFLFFGQTSKVEFADSKEEYRDSYRNRHFPKDQAAYIEARCLTGPEQVQTLRVEIESTGASRRFVDGVPVEQWPFAPAMAGAAQPFVLQHALKNLLLAIPSERFAGFAKLLGLESVDALQRVIVELCTKPQASIPAEASQVVRELETFEGRLTSYPDLVRAARVWKKGAAGFNEAFARIEQRGDALARIEAAGAVDRLARWTQARDDAAARVFAGNVNVKVLSEAEQKQSDVALGTLQTIVDDAFLADYGQLSARGAADRLRKEADLLNLGLDLLKDSPASCPLCGQPLDDGLREHIRERHESHLGETDETTKPGDPRSRVTTSLASLRSALTRYRGLWETRSAGLRSSTSTANRPRVIELLGGELGEMWPTVDSAMMAIQPSFLEFARAADATESAIQSCETAIAKREEAVSQAENLGRAIQQLLSATQPYAAALDKGEPTLVAPAQKLRGAVDALAGTAELSLVIELLKTKVRISRGVRVREVLDGLKLLKKHVEQTVGEVMEEAINTDLTGSVMGWYDRIKTVGDPEVHFSGFAMEKTKAGDFKSKRVQVNAQSYGVDLQSAVSSLSESKLNALGLCVSIANAVRTPGPWGFIVLDDPIQSWDDEHEWQFIQVIRTLVEDERKQVVLLSHKQAWVDQVATGCRTINGLRWNITSYTKKGPSIATADWAEIDERIREADKIARDPEASPVKLQQAEEEVRIAICQLVARVAERRLKRKRGAHNLNSGDVRAILVEAGCPAVLTDKVVATFETTDNAHHAPEKYEASAQRVRQYVGVLNELSTFAGR
jgi:hypothetical protein